MQESKSSILAALPYALIGLANIVTAAISSFITYLIARPKQSADIHKTNADTRKTIAESDKIDSETRQIDSAIMHRAFVRLDELEEINRDQNTQLINMERDKAQVEWKLSLSEQREKIHLEELSLAQAELELLRPSKKPFDSSDPVSKQPS